MPVLSSFKVSGPKTYTAEQIRLYIKVLSGSPIGPEFLVPFYLSEVINPLEEVTSIQKADEIKTRCMVLASSIDDPGAGEGLYAGKSFKEGHVLGKYWGCLALVLDSEVDKYNWFGYENRALLLKAQPFLHTELGPARLYVVGSLNCAMTYMNTVEDKNVCRQTSSGTVIRSILKTQNALSTVFSKKWPHHITTQRQTHSRLGKFLWSGFSTDLRRVF